VIFRSGNVDAGRQDERRNMLRSLLHHTGHERLKPSAHRAFNVGSNDVGIGLFLGCLFLTYSGSETRGDGPYGSRSIEIFSRIAA
jgi:hypothetical protein